MERLINYLPVTVEGKNILITGGTTGIGRATAILLTSMGARVMIFGRHRQELDETIEELDKILKEPDKAGNNRFIGMAADVSNIEDVVAVFKRFDEEFGPI